MREIKFRAWDKAEKTMLKDVIDIDENGYGGYFDKGMTPLQYTGLKDKNGVEIYEGDILALNGNTSSGETIVDVVYKDGCFMLNRTQTEMYGEMLLYEVAHDANSSGASHYCEVIGNIYENPELLS